MCNDINHLTHATNIPSGNCLHTNPPLRLAFQYSEYAYLIRIVEYIVGIRLLVILYIYHSLPGEIDRECFFLLQSNLSM